MKQNLLLIFFSFSFSFLCSSSEKEWEQCAIVHQEVIAKYKHENKIQSFKQFQQQEEEQPTIRQKRIQIIQTILKKLKKNEFDKK